MFFDCTVTAVAQGVRAGPCGISSAVGRERPAARPPRCGSRNRPWPNSNDQADTILAASLAYQFKLDWGATRAKTFRFVVIDEAFGRGSDESTRFGLDLFAKLGLQLLTTPRCIRPRCASALAAGSVTVRVSR